MITPLKNGRPISEQTCSGAIEIFRYWRARQVVYFGGVPVGLENLQEPHRFTLYKMLITRQPLNTVLAQLPSYQLSDDSKERAYELLKQKYGYKKIIIDKFASFEMLILIEGSGQVMHIDCNTHYAGLSVEYTSHCEELHRFESAKLAARQNCEETAKAIHLFDLSPEHLKEMAKLIAAIDGQVFSKYSSNFNLS